MIKVSKLADYAVVILSVMDRQGDRLMSAADIAGSSGLPEPTVAKILKLLTQGQILNSTRGAGGGYNLVKPAREISLTEVICTIDGPIALTSCVDEKEGCCEYTKCCPVRGRWDKVNEAVRATLSKITLAELHEHF